MSKGIWHISKGVHRKKYLDILYGGDHIALRSVQPDKGNNTIGVEFVLEESS